MSGHDLVTIDRSPRVLHPNEVLIVNASLLCGRHVRICSCGQLVAGANAVDVFCHWKSHVAAARAVAQ